MIKLLIIVTVTYLHIHVCNHCDCHLPACPLSRMRGAALLVGV